MRLPLEALIAAALIAAPAAAARVDPQVKLDRMLAGRTAGTPTSCISLYPSNHSTTIDKQAVVYESGGTYYVNRFHGDCPELRDDRILITRTPTDRLCAGDFVRIVSQPPIIEYGTCVLDDFTPYTRTK